MANKILKLATMPADTKETSSWVASVKSEISSPSSQPNTVNRVEYFLAKNRVTAQSWLLFHVPEGSKKTSSGSSSGPGTNVSFVGFSFPGTSILPSPDLNYSMVITAHDELGIQVIAQVAWTPRKSPTSIVASGASRIVVIVNRGLNFTTGKITTVSDTDASTIKLFTNAVNDLAPPLTGVMSCPIDFGATMTLDFYRADAANPYATVVADPSGCGSVTIKQYDTSGTLTSTAYASGGGDLAQLVGTNLGISNWRGQPPTS
jgi:hypothetical protein